MADHRALEALRADDMAPEEAMRWPAIAGQGAYEVWDDAGWETLAQLLLRHTRAPSSENAELTMQESQIARQAEIGAELFLIAHTIEWYLRKAFSKLGLSSRRELSAALPDPHPGRVPRRLPIAP